MSERHAPDNKVVRTAIIAVLAIGVFTFVGMTVAVMVGVPQIREMYVNAFRDLFGP